MWLLSALWRAVLWKRTLAPEDRTSTTELREQCSVRQKLPQVIVHGMLGATLRKWKMQVPQKARAGPVQLSLCDISSIEETAEGPAWFQPCGPSPKISQWTFSLRQGTSLCEVKCFFYSSPSWSLAVWPWCCKLVEGKIRRGALVNRKLGKQDSHLSSDTQCTLG